jgi:Ca-activated chloride channel homolog
VTPLLFALFAAASSPIDVEGRPALFQRPEPNLEAGARHLADGDADAAIESFRKAAASSPNERAIVEYDVGAALLLRAQRSAAAAQPAGPGAEGPPPVDKEALDDARAAFERAYGLARDPRLKSEAALAAGNTAARKSDIDEAIAQYRRAIVADPTNARAKTNLRRMLEAKKAQPPPEQGGDGQQGNDGDKDEERKDEEKKDEEQKEQSEPPDQGQKPGGEQGQDGEDQDKDKDKKSDKDKDKESKDKDKEQAGSSQPEDSEAQQQKKQKKEEARRLLDALRAREKPLTPLEMRGAQKKKQQPKGGKDW